MEIYYGNQTIVSSESVQQMVYLLKGHSLHNVLLETIDFACVFQIQCPDEAIKNPGHYLQTRVHEKYSIT